MNITDVSIKNPVFAWMMMASTVLFGIVALTLIGVSQYPDVDNRTITVSLSWPGASPPAVERQIVEPIEQALSQVEGVQSLASRARSGSARITATFEMSRDVDLALQDIQARVTQAQRSLPKDEQAPTVSRSNPDDTAILTLGVSGPFARQVLADAARYQVQERLQTVPGVGQITLNGVVDRKRAHLAGRAPHGREGRSGDRHHQLHHARARRDPRRSAPHRRPRPRRPPARRGARSLASPRERRSTACSTRRSSSRSRCTRSSSSWSWRWCSRPSSAGSSSAPSRAR